MPFDLTRFSYTPDTWAKLVKNPEDRRDAAKQYIEAVGGKLHGFWYAFGDHDAYNLWEAPDNVSMAATAIAISAGGALSSFQTTVLLAVEETVAALEKASAIRYIARRASKARAAAGHGNQRQSSERRALDFDTGASGFAASPWSKSLSHVRAVGRGLAANQRWWLR